MNPLKHIDIFGSIIMPLLLILLRSNIIFAYAKPVPVNPLYFRNFKKGLRNTSLAGPGINLVMAFLLGSLYGLILFIYSLILRIPASEVLIQNLILLFKPSKFKFWSNKHSILICHKDQHIFSSFNFIPIPPLMGLKL